jgi:PAS domain S-box-containing protein
VAVASVALATWLKYLAQPSIIPTDVPILYVLAVVLTSLFFGLGPSIATCILSIVAYDYFFISPLYTIGPRNVDSIPILFIFILVALTISFLASNLRSQKLLAVSEIVTRKNAETALREMNLTLERRVAERTANLHVSEQRWATTLASIGDAVFATDAMGRITFMNPVAEQFTGWPLSEARNQPLDQVFKIINEQTRQQVENPVTKVLRTGLVVGLANHTLLIRKDGTEVPIDDSGAPILGADGRAAGVVLVFRDITERKKAEEALRQYTAELEVSNKELEAFSYSVSHDLRAPLRSLDGFSQAVIEQYADKLDDTGKDYLMRVRGAAQRMNQITEDMLQLSRVVRSELHRDNVDLSDMASSIVADLKKTQTQRALEFSAVPGIKVIGDESLLRIALSNLLENAWKFTSKLDQARIEFGLIHQDGQEVYFVKDNGAGFDMQYADKLFQPFQRLHSDEEYSGTGIGLAIVQRVIRRHGGRVWAEGEPGKGATFYFTLNK